MRPSAIPVPKGQRRWSRTSLVLGWVAFGLLGQVIFLGLAMAGFRFGDWSGAHIVGLGLFTGASAYGQAWAARRAGLDLAATEYAILVGLGAATLTGASFASALALQGHLALPLRVVGFLLFIAAPMRTLKASGVSLREWWTFSLIGATIVTVLGFIQIFLGSMPILAMYILYPVSWALYHLSASTAIVRAANRKSP